MKTNLIITAIILVFFTFIACNKNEIEIAKPVIVMNELGYNNTSEAFIGNDLHIEAEIVAEGKIKNILIEIHPEFVGNWEFDTIFTEFSGLKNTTFHKHVEIPSSADTGDYHFHFVVTDMEGQQTVFEADIHIGISIDLIAPTITVTNAPFSSQVYSTGDTIRIMGYIEDNQGLGGLYIGLIRVDQNLADTLVSSTNSITLLHSHDFTNPLMHTFNSFIIVNSSLDNNNPPKDLSTGNWWQSTQYYVLVKGKDASGNWAYSQHFPFPINI
jgi:hypothetical protein